MSIHIIPLNDEMRHKFAKCKCQPKIEIQEGGGLLFIHNSHIVPREKVWQVIKSPID